MRYDATRGILDQVTTPFADTLQWTVDSLWRPLGPTVLNGANPDFLTTQVFDTTGRIRRIRLGLGREKSSATDPAS